MPVASYSICPLILLLVVGLVPRSTEYKISSLHPNDRWAPYIVLNQELPLLNSNGMPEPNRLLTSVTAHSQPRPVELFRMLQSGQLEEKSDPKILRRYPKAVSLAINRKIRAEGEKLDNMLGMLKKMEECLKLTEGLRFRKRSLEEAPQEPSDAPTRAPEQVWHQSFDKRDNRIRAMKSLCGM